MSSVTVRFRYNSLSIYVLDVQDVIDLKDDSKVLVLIFLFKLILHSKSFVIQEITMSQ